MAPVLELSRATVAVGGRTVLTDLSLRVERGERVVAVGTHGAIVGLKTPMIRDHCAIVLHLGPTEARYAASLTIGDG